MIFGQNCSSEHRVRNGQMTHVNTRYTSVLVGIMDWLAMDIVSTSKT